MELKRKLKLKKSIIIKTGIFILLILFIGLFYTTFYIYSNNRKIEYYNKNKEYGYIIIDKMSDKFATMKESELHFVKDKNNDLYVVLIDKKDIGKYQNIIDYTYGKKNKSSNIKVNVYPTKNTKEVINASIKNINQFLTLGERININEDNYSKYFSNYYLDCNVKTTYKFNYVVFLLFLVVIIILLLIIKNILKLHKK